MSRKKKRYREENETQRRNSTNETNYKEDTLWIELKADILSSYSDIVRL